LRNASYAIAGRPVRLSVCTATSHCGGVVLRRGQGGRGPSEISAPLAFTVMVASVSELDNVKYALPPGE